MPFVFCWPGLEIKAKKLSYENQLHILNNTESKNTVQVVNRITSIMFGLVVLSKSHLYKYFNYIL